MMNIGICHFRVGGLDGVSLEIAKWAHVLAQMGHHIYLCAGDLGGERGFWLPELVPEHPAVRRILHNAFVHLADLDEAELKRVITEIAAHIAAQLETFIACYALDLLIVENIWALPANPPAALALWNTVRKHGLPVIAHHHDFYWEKPFYNPTCPTVERLLKELFPPRGPLVKHVVINSLARARLRALGITAEVIPNVLDFDAPRWQPDEFNRDFRESLKLVPEDILVLQATRIVRRKGVELAVDLVREMNEQLTRFRGRRLYDGRDITGASRVVLVLSNRPETGYLESGYLEQLQEKLVRTGIPVRLAGELIAPRRDYARKRYSFWDAYVFADLVVYPTLQEGWGNQLLEAVFARKPLVMFEYEVFRADIAPCGFRYVSLGSEFTRDARGLARLPSAAVRRGAMEALQLLTDAQAYRAMVEYNFRLGQRYYSLAALRDHLSTLLAQLPSEDHKIRA